MGFCTICDLLLQVPSSPRALSFPLAPEPPSWGRRGGQIFSHCMPPCSQTQGLHLCRSCPPRAAPSLPDAVEWESSFWEMLCSALAATGAQSRVGGVGLSPSRGRCCSMGTDWLSDPCHRGMAPGGVGGLRGRAVAGAWRAHVPPSPARQRDSLPERQLPRGSMSFPRDMGDVSEWQRLSGEPESLSLEPG